VSDAPPRVILVNRVYWPSTAATAQLLTDLAEGLAAQGWDIHVIAAGEASTRHNGVTLHRTGCSYRHGGLISRLQAIYSHGFHDFDIDGNPFRVQATTTFDLQVAYQVPAAKNGDGNRWLSGTKLTLGCNNLLDKDPPFASSFANNSNGYPGFIYNATGRFVYVSLEKKL